MNYILFNSEKEISIQVIPPQWDGTIEYSYDNSEWKIWKGEKIISHHIYMMGINNTIISNGQRWIINGDNVKCQGNIENVLDYILVKNNIHPKMNKKCFANMFHFCFSLIEAPQLLATELSDKCYYLR